MITKKEFIDLDLEPKRENPIGAKDSISFLLGAGFSIPMGYPKGSDVNKGILNFDEQQVAFSPDGQLATCRDGSKPNFRYTNHYDETFSLCKDLIAAYHSKVKDEFDYEKFMDVLRAKDLTAEYVSVFDKYADNAFDVGILVSNLPDIYSQMVAHLLKDADDNSWYESMPTHIGPYHNEPRASYNGFLQFLSKAKEDYLLNVHTLNHDLFFESFNRTDYINGDISDGFDDYGSRYYGKLYVEGRDLYLCRLERYTGRYYGKPIRLYKLHGSLNYAMMHRSTQYGWVDDCEVKFRYGMGLTDLYRENSRKNGYDIDFFSYHADFLTGATTKSVFYRNPKFYIKLFRQFKNNLIRSKALIVIGYGGKDEGINDYLLNYFDFQNKPCYIVDPCLSLNPQLSALADKMRAKKIEKSISELNSGDFDL